MKYPRFDVGMSVVLPAAFLSAILAVSTAMGANPLPPRVPGGREVPAESGIQSYKGKLVDEASKPISGIFPMTFDLYAGLKSKKSVWSETMWVAVDRGIYTVHLGASKPLPSRSDLDRMVLGVNVRGVGELVREPFVPADLRPPVLTAGSLRGAIPSSMPASGGPSAGPSGKAAAGGAAKYADTAGYAVEADHAKNSDRLSNLTLDEVVKRAADEAGGGSGGGGAAGGKLRIGASKRYGGRIGGSGGTAEYNESCPKGFVMTGIRGGFGNMIDSVQIICSPLE